jgi:hypothetical protein
VSELLDLLPVPAERDLPPGRLEARRAAAVAAVAADAKQSRSGRLRRWLVSIGLLLASIAAVCSILWSANVRVDRTLAVGTAVAVAGGSGLAALAPAPRSPRFVT